MCSEKPSIEEIATTTQTIPRICPARLIQDQERMVTLRVVIECRAMAMRSFFVVLTVLAMAALEGVESNNQWNQATMSVRIRNELPGELTVHCKSRDDDLGVQYLSSWGTTFYFAFKDNFWGSTLFWCGFAYGPKLWNVFNVWKGGGLLGRKSLPCEQCVWAVRVDAFYRAQEGSAPVVAVYPWRSDPHAADAVADFEAQFNATELIH